MLDLAQRLAQAAADAVDATRPKPFDAAVDRFVAALQRLPDYPARDLSNEGFARVNGLAEQVISEIDHRIETGVDETRQVALAQRIYDIRRALEDAFTWRRHFLSR